MLWATGIVGGIVGMYALVSFSEAPLVVALIAVVAIYVITFVRMPDSDLACGRDELRPVSVSPLGSFRGRSGSRVH